MPDRRIICALDVNSLEDMEKMVKTLGDSVSFYKVGMELFYSVGPNTVRYLKEQGKQVFLDLKLHDIPNTVAEGLISLMKFGVDIFNVHASGGFTMLSQAAQRIKEAAHAAGVRPPKLIAITVLTSMNETDWRSLGMTMPIAEQVVNLAKLSQRAGLDGVVASPREAAMIRKACGRDFMIVTPGVRPRGTANNDQSRVAAPAEALRNGANQLVIGRPIYAAPNPKAAVDSILAEIAAV